MKETNDIVMKKVGNSPGHGGLSNEPFKSTVVGFVGNKGGCGKTTMAIAFGFDQVRNGKNVLWIDADPQSNLSQRLGIPDINAENKGRGKGARRHIGNIFLSQSIRSHRYQQSDVMAALKTIVHLQYPYLYKKDALVKKTGVCALIPGNHWVGEHAQTSEAWFTKRGDNLAGYWISIINEARKYFDYIIIDTAPSMQGNKLNEMTVQVVDEVISPFDGVEAASGIKTTVEFIEQFTRPIYIGTRQRPNMMFPMVKYQNDISRSELDPEFDICNATYVAMKTVFGNFVCDSKVKERPSLKRAVPLLATNTNQTEFSILCEEMADIISHERDNFFSVIKPGKYVELETLLEPIRKRYRKGKEPETGSIRFE